MTLTSTTVKLTYNGDGAQESFPVTFNFWDLDDLRVILRDENVTPATETVLTRGATYNVTGGNGSTGTVTIITPPSSNIPVSGEKLIIKSDVPSTQTTALPLGGAIPSASLEQRLDKNVRLVQQREEELDRSIKLSETSTASEVILTDPVTGEFLRWKADGSLESATITGTGVASSVDETDTDTTKDKLISNALAKRAEDTAQAVNGVQVASAVNQLQVTNSIATNPVLVEATGDDTNIDVQIDGKGSGTVNIDKLSSSATDVDMSIAPKGAGDVILGPQVDIPFIGGNVLAQHKGLVIIRPTVATVDIDADDVILEDTDGRFFRASSVNLTATITVSGANGLDTGSEASSTWYHLWVIYNGTTVASLMSLSATAPTMPSGYTFKGYVGAIYNSSGSDLVNINQKGNGVSIVPASALTNGAATTNTSIDISVIVPTTSNSITANLSISNTASSGSIGTIWLDSSSVFGGAVVGNLGGNTNQVTQTSRIFVRTAQTIYYNVNSTNDRLSIDISGWQF